MIYYYPCSNFIGLGISMKMLNIEKTTIRFVIICVFQLNLDDFAFSLLI